VLADLAGRPVTVPASSEHVATGACVQAAAALDGAWPGWKLGHGEVVDPGAVDRDAIRDRYREAAVGTAGRKG